MAHARASSGVGRLGGVDQPAPRAALVLDPGMLTGEGVVLDTRPAGFPSRALGALIDGAVTVAALIGASLALTGVSSDWGAVAAVLLSATLLVVLPTTVETLSRGRSLGKLAVGIRVVRDDGGPIHLRHALARALVGVGELWMTGGAVAIVASLTNARGKRLGDMVAGTYALRVRGGVAHDPLPPVPPHLLAWAAGADVARLPDALALAVRTFLGRSTRLDPASRASLGLDLARRVEPYVSPGPPLGTPPDLFLAAVLTERRERELRHGARATRVQAAQGDAVARLPYDVPDPR